VIGARTLHAFAAPAAPKVPASDDNSDLHAQLVAFFNTYTNLFQRVPIDPSASAARKRLTADLDNDSTIFG